jgi:putative ABC transport system substrate-binding protein
MCQQWSFGWRSKRRGTNLHGQLHRALSPYTAALACYPLNIGIIALGAGIGMRRRDFITLLGGGVLAWPCSAIAQTASRIYRIGLLNAGEPLSDTSYFGAAIIRGFARHGYTLGRNLAFERRGAQAHVDRFPRLLDELVASKVDVILTLSYPATVAAKRSW